MLFLSKTKVKVQFEDGRRVVWTGHAADAQSVADGWRARGYRATISLA